MAASAAVPSELRVLGVAAGGVAAAEPAAVAATAVLVVAVVAAAVAAAVVMFVSGVVVAPESPKSWGFLGEHQSCSR